MSKPKRFIIEKRSPSGDKWTRSSNPGISRGTSFATKEEAQSALYAHRGYLCDYRIRQK